MKHAERVMQIVNDALDTYTGFSKQESELRQKFDREELTGKVFAEQVEDLARKRDAVRTEASIALEHAKAAYRQAVERATEVSGDMLHDDAKLLNMDGLELSARQFTALVEKHRANPLMVQLLQGYQKKHDGLYADYLPTPEQKIEDFNSFVEAGNATLRNPDGLQAAFFVSGKYTPTGATEAE